ncbi:MAG: APC family permease [Actinomycetes bacterium]
MTSSAPLPPEAPPSPPRLRRRLGLGGATLVGLGAMLGAGVFVAFAPAARASGDLLLVSLAVAAVVAACNATSSARLAARYPDSGGTYVYGRERLGPFWGYLAGWGFVVGKTASCAAIALTFAHYLGLPAPRLVAAAAVVALTAVAARGIRASAAVTAVIVVVVLVTLAAVVTAALTSPAMPGDGAPASSALGVLRGGGFLFFAFAGYARVATLGEEVRDPRRLIPRAVTLSLAVVVAVYLAVAVALRHAHPAATVGASPAPVRDLVRAVAPGLHAPVAVAAALATLGSLLALLLGISRTTLAMARDGHLPSRLARLADRTGSPAAASFVVGLAVVVVVLVTGVSGAIGFSSFGVLTYYAIANAAALTLPGALGRAVGVLGLGGCLAVGLSLPIRSVVSGVSVLALGAGWYAARRRWRHAGPPELVGRG